MDHAKRESLDQTNKDQFKAYAFFDICQLGDVTHFDDCKLQKMKFGLFLFLAQQVRHTKWKTFRLRF